MLVHVCAVLVIFLQCSSSLLHQGRHSPSTSVLSSASGTSWSFHVRSSWWHCQHGLTHPATAWFWSTTDRVWLISQDNVAAPHVGSCSSSRSCSSGFLQLVLFCYSHFSWKHRSQKSVGWLPNSITEEQILMAAKLNWTDVSYQSYQSIPWV